MTIPPVPRSGTLSASEQRDVLRGLGFVSIAMIVLPGQDTVAKYLSDVVSPGQITWTRFFLQAVFTLPLVIYFQGVRGLVPNRLWLNALRGALVAMSAVMFFSSIKFMPMADALAIFFVEPFILTILSAVLDKEHVGWRRRAAVTVGFIGVLIVVQPSWSIFGPLSIVPAAGGTLFAVYAWLNRRLSSHDTALTMQFVAGLSACLVLTLLLALGWSVDFSVLAPSLPGGREMAWLLFMGMLGTGGHLCFVHAARLAPSSLVAPMQYVEIVAAAFFGYVVFGDFPSFWKWVGIAIIVCSGAYVFWRESRVR